uniref:Uncharacterized protein n=1 Tax=viral metagenome TaxID=1070528 RepID=A0A6C0IDE9_9ZZZZ
MPTQKKSLEQCLASPQWYKCPLPIMTFLVFLILFVYAIYMTIKCTSLIGEHARIGDTAFEEKYGKKVADINKVYVINLIVLILSLIVVVFFLQKSLPAGHQALLFNEYLGGAILLFIFVVAAWTLSVFNGLAKKSPETLATTFTSIILFVSLAGIGLYAYNLYSVMHSNSASKPKHVQQQHRVAAPAA